MINPIPLEVASIKKSFKNNKVLEDLTLSVKPGSVYGLVGLNGIGKTTLIKIILGLLSQDNGEIKIFGENSSSMEARKKFTYLPEKFHPSMFLKGTEFLELSLGYYKKKYEHRKAIELSEELGLGPSALDKKISGYSKGMGQKLGLVSVFLTEAPLLILDEPMSGLDPSARICLKEKINSYKKSKKTIFFSSHILSDIEEICDQMAVLHDGN